MLIFWLLIFNFIHTKLSGMSHESIIDEFEDAEERKGFECDWCYSKNIEVVRKLGSRTHFKCNYCTCIFETKFRFFQNPLYRTIRKGDPEKRFKYKLR